MKSFFVFIFFILFSFPLCTQVKENQTGAWYMYFLNKKFSNSNWGFQADVQYRDWEVLGDFDQFVVRSGITFTPSKTDILLAVGGVYLTNGTFGVSDVKTHENRVYQDVLLPQKIGSRFLVTHRFRFEQRFVENQDFRTRYRYRLVLNIPVNNTSLMAKTIYASFYNELFINGEKDIGNNKTVEYFDRNRMYFGIGYAVNANIRYQIGFMKQKNNMYSKSQLQISMHHNI